MALQISYDAADGTTHSQSYWRPSTITINNVLKNAQIMFYGYKDRQARLDNKSPVGQRKFVVSTADFPQYFSVNALDNTDLYAACYEAARADTSDFFNGAIDV